MISERVKESLRNRSNIMAIMLCILGVMLNLSLNYLVTVFKLPLYLDTVGTVAIAGMGGYLPGVLVGFCTNIIKTENLGISIESTTTIKEETEKVYAALTGDRIALTDIRLE
ncbi:hypothetical protein BXO88_05440 [Oribacterium sp. C9]|uniref:hypothetical protein n=1 Tax=Oribacterium sp. C9 TaxID=1943579 RepID=UPI00098FC399|nr:hypothetical protein [Oribacterium sp. C9]OON86987.1 hypothetical protein BXO88_05440 [Oribacterium sp. C9]